MKNISCSKDIRTCLEILKEDLFLTDTDFQKAIKIADKVTFPGRPSVIAAGIYYYLNPKTYDMLILTGNITKPSLIKTRDEIKKIKG